AWSTVQAMRADPIDLLRGAGSPQASVGRGAGMLRQTLLLIQAAVFAILLTGAAAFVRSLARASAVDFGFDVEAVYSARVSLPAGTPRARAREFMERAHERVSALPGIASASLGYMEPWMNNTEQRISIPGSTVKPPPILFDMATPEYLRTFGVGMRQGRWIDATDGPHAPPVVVINEALERVFWPAGGAIGQCIRVGADSMPCRTIVGVVRNFKVTGGADDPARPVYFLPLEQASAFPQRPVLFFRPRGDAAAAARTVREVFQTLEANLPTVGVHPVRENIDWLLSPLRLGAAAFTTFGVVAAIVGAVGLYSVLAFLILEARRAHAIRLAIGAPPRYLAQSVVRFAVVTVIAGMVAGYIAFVPVAGVLEPLLFHTRALEPATVAVVFLFGVLIALAAAIVPMRAVMRTDVMGVLREQ
ncbi:MAG TPA: ABC transporter permease, partial [Gemmatimonadaceae bacterium]|nr:ABC transporter permease [Gemmatimonadaceae bacterium]